MRENDQSVSHLPNQRVGRNARGASIDGNGLFGFLNSRRLGLGFASSAGGQVSTAERSAKHTEG